MADMDMDQATSSSASVGAPYQMLYAEDLGLDGDYNREGDLRLKDETATICGKKLNPKGTRSGVKDTVIGGVLCLGHINYAMTSKRSHDNVSHSHFVTHHSKKNLDWALCQIFVTIKLPNVHGSTRLIHYNKEEDLPEIPGTVKVLAGRGEEFEARLGTGDGWVTDAFPGVKLVGLITQLPNKTIIPRGAWVVKDDSLCGYVVHCEPGGNLRTGYMVPIERAFKEMEHILKVEPVFPFTTSWDV